MQFLVICRLAAGGDPDEFSRLVPFETEAMREQKARGTLTSRTGNWAPFRSARLLAAIEHLVMGRSPVEVGQHRPRQHVCRFVVVG